VNLFSRLRYIYRHRYYHVFLGNRIHETIDGGNIKQDVKIILENYSSRVNIKRGRRLIFIPSEC